MTGTQLKAVFTLLDEDASDWSFLESISSITLTGNDSIYPRKDMMIMVDYNLELLFTKRLQLDKVTGELLQSRNEAVYSINEIVEINCVTDVNIREPFRQQRAI